MVCGVLLAMEMLPKLDKETAATVRRTCSGCATYCCELSVAQAAVAPAPARPKGAGFSIRPELARPRPRLADLGRGVAGPDAPRPSCVASNTGSEVSFL